MRGGLVQSLAKFTYPCGRKFSRMELSLALTVICIVFPSFTSSSYLSSNFVLEPYDFLFDTAVEAYYKGDWLSVILNMEKALRNRVTIRKVKADCRLRCSNQTAFEDPGTGLGISIPGAGSVEDLTFFRNILKRADCVNSCEREKLGIPTLHQASEEVELEFRRRTPYNYLQVAYFKINKLDKAVAAANTFFQANKDHVEMRQNLDYYGTVSGVQEEDFKDLEARPHMAKFLMGKSYYSSNSYSLAAKLFEVAVTEYFIADEECRAICEGSYKYDGYNYMEYNADLYQTMTDHYIQVLNCKQRCSVELAFTDAGSEKPLENFLPSHFNYLQFSYYNSENYELAIECAKTYLLFHPDDEVMKQNLAYYSAMLGLDKSEFIPARQAAALKGDGYQGHPSPHSPGEMFQGVTILKAVKLAQEGKVSLKGARLFFDVSEKVKKVLESYFSLGSPLYFSYSHLVCRSAIEGKQETRSDLSHPVHVDNCLLVSELNECLKEPPAYTNRDHSAILYLNDDFEGGDFIFTELDAKVVTAVVRPLCGRVVGFGAGKENPHGVRAVTKGQRCAVALWFTLDPAYEEKERIQAQHMLDLFSTTLMPDFNSKEAMVNSDYHPLVTEPTRETDKAIVNRGEATDVEQVNTYNIHTEKAAEVKKDGIQPANIDGQQTPKSEVEQLDAVKMDPKTPSMAGSQTGKDEL
ncbi:prolyl 3-hydroxylase 1-like isoform X2 [Festucalex cinctus]